MFLVMKSNLPRRLSSRGYCVEESSIPLAAERGAKSSEANASAEGGENPSQVGGWKLVSGGG